MGHGRPRPNRTRPRPTRTRPIYKGLSLEILDAMGSDPEDYGSGLSPGPHILDPDPPHGPIYILELFLPKLRFHEL